MLHVGVAVAMLRLTGHRVLVDTQGREVENPREVSVVTFERQVADDGHGVVPHEFLDLDRDVLEVVTGQVGHHHDTRHAIFGRSHPCVLPGPRNEALRRNREHQAVPYAINARRSRGGPRRGQVVGHGSSVQSSSVTGSSTHGSLRRVLNNPAARRIAAVVVEPIARGLLRMRISPDAVTVLGTVGTCAGALAFFPRGEFLPGVLIICAFVLSDLLDGTMARLSGTAGPWGNFLDSTLDRIADGAVFGSFLIWAVATQDWWVTAGALAALIGGQVTSYAKARAESVGATANVGIAERAERLIIGLGAALLAGLGVPYVLPGALMVLGVLSGITVVQRMVHVRAQLRTPPS